MRNTRIIVTHYGGPDALRVVEEECPEPKHGEVRVADVARSIEWYRGTLGFVGDPFPAAPPHEFEITDPDGYAICLSQLLEDGSDLPTPSA